MSSVGPAEPRGPIERAMVGNTPSEYIERAMVENTPPEYRDMRDWDAIRRRARQIATQLGVVGERAQWSSNDG